MTATHPMMAIMPAITRKVYGQAVERRFAFSECSYTCDSLRDSEHDGYYTGHLWTASIELRLFRPPTYGGA
jgi:hypothetical protein